MKDLKHKFGTIDFLVYNSPASRDFVAFQAPTKYIDLNPATCCSNPSGIYISRAAHKEILTLHYRPTS